MEDQLHNNTNFIKIPEPTFRTISCEQWMILSKTSLLTSQNFWWIQTPLHVRPERTAPLKRSVWPLQEKGLITTYMKDLQLSIDLHMSDIMTTYPIGSYVLKYWRGEWGRWRPGRCALLGSLGNKNRQESQWELILVLISIMELAASAERGLKWQKGSNYPEELVPQVELI